jgi:succinate dehydrogenase hydrophobic anchor subunit
MTRAKLALPRDTTRQSEMLLYGALAYQMNRWSGILILAYLSLHLVGQAVLNVQELRGLIPAFGFLGIFQYQPWVRAVLFAAITFHLFYGLNLIALDLGARLKYRTTLLAISALAILNAVWELLRYVRH